MTGSLTTIAIASLIGSIHCAAMCGPLVALHGGARTLRLAVIHSLGRLTTYCAIGALAGGLGKAIDRAGELAVVQHAATITAGIAIVGWGAFQLAGQLRATPTAARPTTTFGDALVRIRTTRGAAVRAWLIGVLTGLLPCGWLWAFAVSAAGTGSPLDGITVMVAFWLGTVPAMLGVLTFGGPIVMWLRRRLPIVTALVVVAIGIATLARRWDAVGGTAQAPACHGEHAR